MSDQPQDKKNLPSLGFLPELIVKVKLVVKLLADPRVSPLIKILPIGGIIYWIVPTDLIPIVPIDDAFILWLAGTLFIELCPQDVVQEHLNALRQESVRAEDLKSGNPPVDDTAVIDAEYRDITGQEGRPRS
jgi:hypothetical protein